MADVSVIVPARDGAATIDATLHALARQRYAGSFEVIVVDNGSRDDTVARARAHGVRVLERERGEGPGAARNDGVRAATASLLAFTDSDCRPAEGWLAAGVAALGDADLVQGRVEPDPADPRSTFDRTVVVRRERGFYETANLFMRRELFDRVGGFEDWLLAERPDARPLGEDVLFAWTARRLGGRTAFSDAALVHHAVFPGSLRTFLDERARLVDFPALARRVPELRREVFFAGLFLNRRSAAFDGAVAGALAAAATRRPGLLLAAAPWLALTVGKVRRAGARRGLKLAAIELLSDGATLVALTRGSARHRTPLL